MVFESIVISGFGEVTTAGMLLTLVALLSGGIEVIGKGRL
jgi:hypothetical protein